MGQQQINPDALIERLQEVPHRLISQNGVRHAVLGVESLDGSFRWSAAKGEANPGGRPMTPDTPFFIASISKLYIAAIILKLHERGCLSLSESISAYLPQSLIGGIHRLGGVDYTDRISVINLLSHTSGLPDYIEESPKGGRPLVQRLVEDGDMLLTIDDVVCIARDDLTPHFPPQSHCAGCQKARYSDTNYQLLIAVIESVTGRSLDQAYTEFLLRPLNLRHTWHPGHPLPECSSEPATLWFGDKPVEIPLAMRSLGDLYSTVDDTLEFLRALIQGRVFEDPLTFGLMQRRWNRFGFSIDPAALRSPGWPIEYGLGIMRFCLPRIFTPMRRMPAVIGHTGSTGCWLFYCPELKVLLSGTVDQGTAGALPYRLVPGLLRSLEKTMLRAG